MIENRNLIIREMLDQIQHETLRHGPNINQKDIREKMKEQAARMQKIIHSTIVLPNTALAEDEEFLYNFNCYAYALGLWTKESTYNLIQKYLEESGKHLVNSLFIKKLILNKTILIQDAPMLNHLVLYFNHEQKIKHAGIIKELDPLIVESKWGEYPVMQHTIWNVPLSYGSDIGFYILPSLDKIEFEINNIILN
jgi:hypothetical protein